ncbi:hypothetical protein C8A05DRAFT_46114 [Staphylotrichum tortipilum]|uniref:Chromosome transmission fidelity protein 4 n=1 Tax=Staphylotrichum tortipilum TaxID=2831512 RepID=A0AAN6MHB6_9PEZI|nr:hypothetical protein C8A05DRAFT_46114 [Staphylotrichum longicolle]
MAAPVRALCCRRLGNPPRPYSIHSIPSTSSAVACLAASPIPEQALFAPHRPLLFPEPGNNKPPDERKVKLGKTLRTLQTLLPTLLQSPLPNSILAPNITLHLFPSTHPHLPTVTGRVAYTAALWSSPIAWNRVPLVGNVRLEILSERMVDNPIVSVGKGGPEQLVVRWRTVGGRPGWLAAVLGGGGKGKGAGGASGEGKKPVGTAMLAVSENNNSKEFTGLFIFEFDGEGRILSHTIEHMQAGGQWEKGVGAKVVGLTDWLLGGIRGGDAPCPAFARARWRKGR